MRNPSRPSVTRSSGTFFTKCGQNWYHSSGNLIRDLRPASIRFECEQSLRRLDVARIDLYQFHWPDNATGTLIEDSWATMVKLIEAGKVRWGRCLKLRG